MSVVVPSHRIHTIYSTFGPGFGLSTPVSAADAFAHLPNITVAASRSRGPGLSPRTASASLPSPSSGSRSIARRYPASPRRAPPPPPRVSFAPSSCEDPFADQVGTAETTAQAAHTTLSISAPLIASRTRIASYAAPSTSIAPQSLLAPSPSVPVTLPPGIALPSSVEGLEGLKGRLVANVLLSRRHGRPLRRRPESVGEPRVYMRSGLSRMVELDA
ncbi:uncharacterized protein FIBRA_06735 [Fibroporia radiculosa]|uniref:Uncharacterized protein n=1 Tax=Fibroporia radiculosa TaxID=599839 RepID=J4H485_9APHY|nr:uncharacterized protein FIBRA_06735 [Fibroporia radiculosa]CCM04554.1 predicted protein [Fibroporia radiculosa]